MRLQDTIQSHEFFNKQAKIVSQHYNVITNPESGVFDIAF
jgi:hypothetical protein